jgi:hypothetical protein
MMRHLDSLAAGVRFVSFLLLALMCGPADGPAWVSAQDSSAGAAQPPPAAAQAEDAEASPSDQPLPELQPESTPPAAAPKQTPAQAPAKFDAAASAPACGAFRVRDYDQVWVVSTRHLGCPGGYLPTYQVWRYEAGYWQPRSSEEFYAADSPDVVTAFYIHGNRISHSQAFQDGLDVYFQLVGRYGDRPVRFVVWSWPSDQIKGPLNDVRAKAARSDVDAYYLAHFLTGMNPAVPVGITGYSFGARITTGALHALGGGAIMGQTVPSGARPQVRVALWAAAVHNHWLVPGNYHGNALPMADAWFNTLNYCDPVLERYRMLEKCSDPEALGYAGLAGRNLISPDLNDRFEERNVSHLVGRTHDMQPYLYSSYIQQRTRQYVLWYELFAPAAVPLAAAQ